jgi:S-adenosylmethionine hydrolase
MQPVIALLTDFGTADTYVGVMKGVMLGIRSQTRFIDITHAIQPQNVRQAAFALMNAYSYFPKGTIFVVVVDPGVGSSRRPLIVSAGGYLFVGPDNGVFSYVLNEWDDATLLEPTETRFLLPQVSSTFHGRDVFAPLAAHLAADTPLQAMGLVITDPVLLPTPVLEIDGDTLRGEIVHVDRFGNAVTSIGALRWGEDRSLTLLPRFGDKGDDSLVFDAASVTVRAGSATLGGIQRTYAEVSTREPLAMIGSDGFLEIAINQANAADALGLKAGDLVTVELAV